MRSWKIAYSKANEEILRKAVIANIWDAEKMHLFVYII